MPRPFLALPALLLLACSQTPPAAIAPAPAPIGSPIAPPTAASGVKTKAAEPDSDRPAALARCANAYNDFSEAPAEAKLEAANAIAVACSDLYTQRDCADAFRLYPSQPVESKVASLVAACRDAYCPRLQGPKPALCTAPELPPPSLLPEAWRELNARILATELDLAPAQLDLVAQYPFHFAAAVPVQAAAQSAVPASEVKIVLRYRPNGVELVVDNGPVMRVAAGDNAGYGKVARSALGNRKGASVRVVIAADKRIAFGQIVSVMDALRSEGITHIAFMVEPSSGKP